jgi:hypothetical protein
MKFVYTPDNQLFPLSACDILTVDDLVPACTYCDHPLVRAPEDPRDGVCPRGTRRGHATPVQVPRTWAWRIKGLMNPTDYPPGNGWLPLDLTGLEGRL